MRFVMSRVLLVLGVLLLAVNGARLVGHAQPPPRRVLLLHLTDCELPCWIGIVPGVSTYDEAAALIRRSYPATAFAIEQDSKGFSITPKASPETLRVSLFIRQSSASSEPIIASIGLYFAGRSIAPAGNLAIYTPPGAPRRRLPKELYIEQNGLLSIESLQVERCERDFLMLPATSVYMTERAFYVNNEVDSQLQVWVAGQCYALLQPSQIQKIQHK